MIDLERDGSVFLLRMREGENRIGCDFLGAFGAALDEVERAEGGVALVTTGEGKFYSNGLDVAGLSRADAREVGRAMTGLHRLFARLLAFPAPTVAALNGHTFAAGAMLALAHDFRYMRRDRGYLCLPEIDMATGQPLTPGMFALMGARLERAVFHEALVSGHRYPAEEAMARGLVDEVAAEDALLDRAVDRAGELAAKAGDTLAALKRGLYAPALAVLERA